MKMMTLAMIALLAFASACGGLSSPETPGNQSYRFEGLETAVTWDASENATHYIVYYSRFLADDCDSNERNSFSSCVQLADNIVETRFDHTSPSSENYYWVVACDNSECSEIDESNPAQLNGPPKPEGLICDPFDANPGSPPEPVVSTSWEGPVMRFNWVPSPGPRPTHYNIYYEVQSNSEWFGCMYPLAENLAETTFALQDLVKPIPPAPLGVRVTGRTSESLTIEWEPFPFLERYETEYAVSACNSAGCSNVLSGSALAGIPHDVQHFALSRISPEGSAASDEITMEIRDVRKYLDVGLLPNTVYSYEISACNEIGCSQATPTAGLTETDGPVDIPASPRIRAEKVEVGGTDDAMVTWDEVNGATYYRVYQEWKFDAEVSAPGTGYYDSNPNSSFFAFYATTYTVTACNKAGCSAPSQESTAQ